MKMERMCKSCGTEVLGNFCQDCGEKFIQTTEEMIVEMRDEICYLKEQIQVLSSPTKISKPSKMGYVPIKKRMSKEEARRVREAVSDLIIAEGLTVKDAWKRITGKTNTGGSNYVALKKLIKKKLTKERRKAKEGDARLLRGKLVGAELSKLKDKGLTLSEMMKQANENVNKYMIKNKPDVPLTWAEKISKTFSPVDVEKTVPKFPKIKHLLDNFEPVFENMLQLIIKNDSAFTSLDAQALCIDVKDYVDFICDVERNADKISIFLGVKNKFKVIKSGNSIQLVYR